MQSFVRLAMVIGSLKWRQLVVFVAVKLPLVEFDGRTAFDKSRVIWTDRLFVHVMRLYSWHHSGVPLAIQVPFSGYILEILKIRGL